MPGKAAARDRTAPALGELLNRVVGRLVPDFVEADRNELIRSVEPAPHCFGVADNRVRARHVSPA